MKNIKKPPFKIIYSEDVLSGIKKIDMEEYFVDAFNRATLLRNPYIDVWTTEFITNLAGTKDMRALGIEELNALILTINVDEYNHFIFEKSEVLFDKFNEVIRYPIKVCQDRNANICGTFKYDGRDIFMYLIKDTSVNQ